MSSYPARRAVACRVLWMLAVCAGTHAPLIARADAIDLPEALARTVTEHPRLVAAGYQIEAARGRLQQARLAPNPALSMTIEDGFGSSEYRGLRRAETTLTLDWVLERGVRGHVIGVAESGLALQGLDAEIARLDAAADTGLLFVESLAHQAHLELAREAVALAGETVAIVGRRVDVGAAPRAELARALADLARAELAADDVEHELRTLHRRLSAQWGESPPRFTSVQGDLRALPAAEPFAILLARAEANPELARFAAQRRLEQSELRLAEARRQPPWTLSMGVRRYGNTDDTALVAGMQMPLTLRDRNEGRIAEARARIQFTDAETEAARVRLETTLFALHQELEHSRHVAERLASDVIPLIDQAVDETRRAYELGRYGYLEWRAAQTELLQAREALLAASADAHRLVIEMERLTGVPAVLETVHREDQR